MLLQAAAGSRKLANHTDPRTQGGDRAEALAANVRYVAKFDQPVWLEPCHANGTATVQASLIDRTGI